MSRLTIPETVKLLSRDWRLLRKIPGKEAVNLLNRKWAVPIGKNILRAVRLLSQSKHGRPSARTCEQERIGGKLSFTFRHTVACNAYRMDRP
jgi:hypothetical protein